MLNISSILIFNSSLFGNLLLEILNLPKLWYFRKFSFVSELGYWKPIMWE